METPQISKIATVEVPVTDLKQSIQWYTRVLGLKIHHQGEKDAMLLFSETGTATIYLVETSEKSRLSFYNTNTGVTHSVIDFYTPNLKGFYEYLTDQNVEVGTYNADLEDTESNGGFGFKDPDGNMLSACNIDHDSVNLKSKKELAKS